MTILLIFNQENKLRGRRNKKFQNFGYILNMSVYANLILTNKLASKLNLITCAQQYKQNYKMLILIDV